MQLQICSHIGYKKLTDKVKKTKHKAKLAHEN